MKTIVRNAARFNRNYADILRSHMLRLDVLEGLRLRKDAQTRYEKLRNIDPVQVVEDMGMVVTSNNLGGMLALELQVQKSRQVNAALAEMGDTQLSNNLSDYLRIAASIGFEVVLKEPFNVSRPDYVDGREVDHEYTEHYYVLAHRQYGLILEFDTYTYESIKHDPHVNSGQFYYAWQPKKDEFPRHILSSGGLESKRHPSGWRRDPEFAAQEDANGEWRFSHPTGDDAYYNGHTDCRQGLRYTIELMAEHGTFLTPWPKLKNRYVSLANYAEWSQVNPRGTEIDQISKARIKRLPDWVQQIINADITEEVAA